MEPQQESTRRDEALTVDATREGIQRSVVALALVRNGAVLLLQRRPDDFMGSIFELPGGKVEPDEELQAALNREVREETSLLIKGPVRYVGSFDYASQSGQLTRQFTFVRVTPEVGEVVLREHAGFEWFPLDRITDAPVTPETRALLQRVAVIIDESS